MSQIVTVSQMKEMAKLYAQRMQSASQNGLVDLNNENLFLKLSKSDLNNLMKDPAFDGFVGVLGLDNTDPTSPTTLTQTFMLVPVDSSGKAIKTNGVMQGLERHIWDPPKLNAVINPDVVTGVEKAFNNMNIKD